MAATIDEVTDALLDNADFEEDNDLTKAKAFVTAAMRFLILTPSSQSDQGSSLAMGLAQVESMLAQAKAFIKANDTASANKSKVRFLSVGEGFYR